MNKETDMHYVADCLIHNATHYTHAFVLDFKIQSKTVRNLEL